MTRPPAPASTAGMTADDLTPEQARDLHARLGPMLQYIHALAKRIQMWSFPDDDPLKVKTHAARVAIQALCDEVRVRERRGA